MMLYIVTGEIVLRDAEKRSERLDRGIFATIEKANNKDLGEAISEIVLFLE